MHVQSGCRVDLREPNPIVLGIVMAAGRRVLRTASRQKRRQQNDESLAKGRRSCGADSRRGGGGPGGGPSDQKRGAGAGVRAASVHLDRVLHRSERRRPLAERQPFGDDLRPGCRYSMAASSMLRSRAVSDRKASDFIGGGQAGYNWQTGAFVLGVETDFDGSTISKSFNNVGTPFLGAGVPAILAGDFLSVNGKASLSWLGTTRGPRRLRRHA